MDSRSLVWRKRQNGAFKSCLLLGSSDCPSAAAPELSHINKNRITRRQTIFFTCQYICHAKFQFINKAKWILRSSKTKDSETKPKMKSFLVQYHLSRMTIIGTWFSVTHMFSFCGLQYVKSLLHSTRRTSRSYTVAELAHIQAKIDCTKRVLKHLSCADSAVPLPQVSECNIISFTHTP